MAKWLRSSLCFGLTLEFGIFFKSCVGWYGYDWKGMPSVYTHASMEEGSGEWGLLRWLRLCLFFVSAASRIAAL